MENVLPGAWFAILTGLLSAFAKVSVSVSNGRAASASTVLRPGITPVAWMLSDRLSWPPFGAATKLVALPGGRRKGRRHIIALENNRSCWYGRFLRARAQSWRPRVHQRIAHRRKRHECYGDQGGRGRQSTARRKCIQHAFNSCPITPNRAIESRTHRSARSLEPLVIFLCQREIFRLARRLSFGRCCFHQVSCRPAPAPACRTDHRAGGRKCLASDPRPLRDGRSNETQAGTDCLIGAPARSRKHPHRHPRKTVIACFHQHYLRLTRGTGQSLARDVIFLPGPRNINFSRRKWLQLEKAREGF